MAGYLLRHCKVELFLGAGIAGLAKRATLKARELSQQSQSQEKSRSHQHEGTGGEDDGSATDVDISQVSLPEDIVVQVQGRPTSASASHKPVTRKPSTTESMASRSSEIPLIKISKEDDRGQSREKTGRGQPPAPLVTAAIPPATQASPATSQETKPTVPLPPSTSERPRPSTSKQPDLPAPSPVGEPSKRERIMKALISRAKNKV